MSWQGDWIADKAEARSLAARLGWLMGQKVLYRPHSAPMPFETWLAARAYLERITGDQRPPQAQPVPKPTGPLPVATQVRRVTTAPPGLPVAKILE